ncbi:MAG: discoidin domain-containing protein, partial [Eubacteriales bacterium]
MKHKHRTLVLGLTLGAVLLLTLLLAACRGGSEEQPTVAPESATDEPDTPTPDTAPETPTETSTEAPTETPTEPESETEPETEDPNAIPTVGDDVIGVANVAKEGYAMASSSARATKRSNIYINDGKTNTDFASGDFDAADREAWLFIDLTATYTLRSVVLFPTSRDMAHFPVSFAVQVSDDGQTWRTVQEMTGVRDVASEGVTVDMGGVSASFVRLLVTEMAGEDGAYHYALSDVEVLADITAKDNLILNQSYIWLYDDTSETLTAAYRRLENTQGDPALRFISADPSIAAVDHETGVITPTGYGDTVVYAYDGTNLTACRVRIIDQRETSVRISTFYHSSFGYPQYMAQVLDYMKDCGITFLEDTRTYDAVGNQVCDYLMYLCGQRDIFLSVCDPLNSGSLIQASDTRILTMVDKYRNRAGFGGIYLTDEPHEESNEYARVAHLIQEA